MLTRRHLNAWRQFSGVKVRLLFRLHCLQLSPVDMIVIVAVFEARSTLLLGEARLAVCRLTVCKAHMCKHFMSVRVVCWVDLAWVVGDAHVRTSARFLC